MSKAVQLKMVLIIVLLGLGFAQSKLEPFKPAPLPETIKPKPIPTEMTDIPANISFGNKTCSPALRGVMIPVDLSGVKPDAAVSKQIQAIVDADQKARQPGGHFSELEDRARRKSLLPLVPKAVTSQDFANIALVFQHGDCVDSFMFANALASMAIKLEPAKAKYESRYVDPRWLYAATLDRALQNARKAQKFGTQYLSANFFDEKSCLKLYVIDPRTTDQERAEYNVPKLKQAIAQAKKMSVPNCTP